MWTRSIRNAQTFNRLAALDQAAAFRKNSAQHAKFVEPALDNVHRLNKRQYVESG
jgi:hypothetical protein